MRGFIRFTGNPVPEAIIKQDKIASDSAIATVSQWVKEAKPQIKSPLESRITTPRPDALGEDQDASQFTLAMFGEGGFHLGIAVVPIDRGGAGT
ncbi:hypothetical protein ABKV19_004820 [Rosa sericea]